MSGGLAACLFSQHLFVPSCPEQSGFGNLVSDYDTVPPYRFGRRFAVCPRLSAPPRCPSRRGARAAPRGAAAQTLQLPNHAAG